MTEFKLIQLAYRTGSLYDLDTKKIIIHKDELTKSDYKKYYNYSIHSISTSKENLATAYNTYTNKFDLADQRLRKVFRLIYTNLKKEEGWLNLKSGNIVSSYRVPFVNKKLKIVSPTKDRIDEIKNLYPDVLKEFITHLGSEYDLTHLYIKLDIDNFQKYSPEEVKLDEDENVKEEDSEISTPKQESLKSESKEKKKKKAPISKELRTQVWSTYNGRSMDGKCFVCDERITLEIFECGHVDPESRGGKTELSNLRPVCKECNHGKGGMSTMNMIEYMLLNKKAGCIHLDSKDIEVRRYKDIINKTKVASLILDLYEEDKIPLSKNYRDMLNPKKYSVIDRRDIAKELLNMMLR